MKHRPADVNQLGKLVTDIAVGDVEDVEPKSNRAHWGHARAAAMNDTGAAQGERSQGRRRPLEAQGCRRCRAVN